MIQFHLTPVSGNAKTGPIPVSTTSKESCPRSCPFYASGCYAKSGPLNLHWDKIAGARGIAKEAFLKLIKKLNFGQLWRHNQAGDLPALADGVTIDREFLRDLTAANKGKRGFTYTHRDLIPENVAAIREANENGFTVNLSGNNPAHAVEIAKLGLPTTAVVPSTETRKHWEQDGRKFLVCPATYREQINCANCGLCQKSDRKYIVAFPAHGTAKKAASAVAERGAI